MEKNFFTVEMLKWAADDEEKRNNFKFWAREDSSNKDALRLETEIWDFPCPTKENLTDAKLTEKIIPDFERK